MSLELIIGPMFAGKSSAILQKIRQAEALGWNCCIITANIDVRYDTSGKSIHTHANDYSPAIGLSELKNALHLLEFRDAKYVIIDEAQFFPDLYSVVMEMVEECNKNVIVVGLDGDANRKAFGQIQDLYPKADRFTKLTAMCKLCRDGTPGIFTMKHVTSAEQVCVGGADMYSAVCRKHFLSTQ